MKVTINTPPPLPNPLPVIDQSKVLEDDRLASVNQELLEARAEVRRLRDILDDAGIPYQKQRGLFQGNLRK